MFKKILIANRGEIACRVIKTARLMGIKTVAVYSDVDAEALHVEMADEAVHIGPPAAAESYLIADKIIEACKTTNAEAVHPGYGFLSENANFAKSLEKEGIAFIGPNVKAIEVMGDKIASKKFAGDAKVSTVPGSPDLIKDAAHALAIAKDIGFPVMIKASAGGGGKGMRIAMDESEVEQGFISSQNEARSSFGDDRIFIEKFIVDPRHIEIQVLADKHGNTIYLGERECSIQRRNQKVIEEAPSPFLDEATRKAMGEQAVALSKAVNYESAGTVEFIVDKDRNFYFLEMNTRLQVEHPVTELVTGVDLVEQMIRVAAGEKLSLAQKDVTLTGWALESRLYAEDPYRNFLPSIGRLVRYMPPEESVVNGLTIRNDTGVREGDEISLYYDPMIAKLCTHGPDRLSAIDHMTWALDRFHIEGIGHNIPFLNAVYEQDRFREGRLTTGYIAEEFPNGFVGVTLEAEALSKMAAIATFVQVTDVIRMGARGDVVLSQLDVRSDWMVCCDGQYIETNVNFDGNTLDVTVNGHKEETYRVISRWRPGWPLFVGAVGGDDVAVGVKRTADGWELSYRGATLSMKVLSPRIAELEKLMPERIAPDTSKMLLCPMPGLVVSLNVEVGQAVGAGETLAVVEAMKMENVLKAERDCVIKTVNAGAGDSLAVDDVIIEFE
jgi:propionyl-CoA carboxylase alpha subunit